MITPAGSVLADHVILAGNGYLDALEPALQSLILPINNFIVATEPLGSRAHALLPDNHAVADSRFVVNYFRRTHDDRLLFGGGENYGYRFPADIEGIVRKSVLKVFPQLAGVRLEHAWGGTLAVTRSRLPLVQQCSPRLMAAGGYSGHGLALAVQAGHLMARVIEGDRTGFDLLASLPVGRFPGGGRWRTLIQAAGMSGSAWLDRL